MSEGEMVCPFFYAINVRGSTKTICELGDKSTIDNETGKEHKFDTTCRYYQNFQCCTSYNTLMVILNFGLPTSCPYREICDNYQYEDGLEQTKDIPVENRSQYKCNQEFPAYRMPISYVGCFHFSKIFWEKKVKQKEE